MADLIPQYSLTEFKKLNADQLKGLKCCELTVDGEYVCTVIIPPLNGGMSINDHCRAQAAYLGVSGNSVGGKELSELQAET